MIKEQSPRTARFLEDIVKFGGVTIAMMDELESEKIEAEHLRKLEYGDKQWSENLLRPGYEPNLTKRMDWVNSIADPWLLRATRRESELGRSDSCVPKPHTP
jgi:hypothetical protein